MTVEILRSDLSPFDPDTPVPFLEAGQDSGVLELALRNPGPGDERDLLLVVQVEDPSRPGEFVSLGFAPQDELWCRARLVGQSGNPAQQDLRTDWVPLGAYGALHVPEILENGIRRVEVKFRPPSTASTTPSWRWALSVIAQEHARAVPPALTAAQSGVLARLGDRTAAALILGCNVEPSDPPDDQVSVTAGQYLAAGEFVSRVRSVHPLDQTDGEGEELAAGESYYAVVSLGATGVEITKGTKASSAPARPAPPAGTARSRSVLVHYQGAGTSIIEAQDVEGELVYDRYLALPGDGLQVLVHAGQSIAGGTWRFHSGVTPIAVEADATNRIWELATGLFEVAPTPPDPGALLLWEADTDADAVLELRDRRTFAGETVVLRLRGALPDDPGEIDSLLVQHDVLVIERMTFRLPDNGGASGETVLDVLRNGGTAFPSQAEDDQRPHFPFDATELVSEDGLHEVTELRRGDLLTLVSAEHPSGGAPARAEVYLHCRRF